MDSINYEHIEKVIKENSTKPRMWMHELDNPAEHMMPLWDMIRKYFKHDFIVAEIGVFNGGATELFALWCKRVYAIDKWDDIPLQDEFFSKSGNAKANLQEAERLFNIMNSKYINVFKIRELSEHAKDRFKNNILDAVYIDANHRYECVIEDLKWWIPKIKKGGYICGHDYYDDVKKAVNDTIGEPDEVFWESSWIKEI